MEIITAIDFYRKIQKEENMYRLVNGLFIVKYINGEESILVGEFERAGSVFNPTQTNKIKLVGSGQRFNKNKNMTTTSLGFWKNLSIEFKEKPIREILK